MFCFHSYGRYAYIDQLQNVKSIKIQLSAAGKWRSCDEEYGIYPTNKYVFQSAVVQIVDTCRRVW